MTATQHATRRCRPWHACDRSLLDDPYSNYELIRDRAPIHYVPERDEWFFVNYEPVSRIMRDPVTFSSNRRIALAPDEQNRTGASLVLLSEDPPVHTRNRALISRWFTSYSVNTMKPFVEEVVDEIVTRSFVKGVDFAQEFAVPVPVMVAAKLIGVDTADWQKLSTWSRAGVGTLASEPRASYNMINYFRCAIRQRRDQPDDNLISFLIGVERDEGPLSDIDILKFCVLLLTAGSETTSNLLGNMFHLLAGRNDLWQRLRYDRQLVDLFINETLRYESPIQFFSRVVTEPVDFDGYTLNQGSTVVLCAGAANRDPRVFKNPHVFNVERPDAKKHLAFSYGIHYCLGAAMAKMEISVVLEAMLDRFSSVSMAGEADRVKSTTIRGFSHLPLRFE